MYITHSSALKKDGVLSVKSGAGGTTLNCPLKEITLYRVCKAVEPDFLGKLIGVHRPPSPLCPVGRGIHGVLDASYDQVRKDLRESLESINMEEIVNRYRHL